LPIRESFDARTTAVFLRKPAKGLAHDLVRRVRRRLQELDAASNLGDLAARPGNRLEALRGDRRGQWSIRVNDQWRICFVWRDGDAYRVELVDYH
jgi:proteic killer suppression protein